MGGMRIYLTGFMGAGKSTIGRLLAAELGYDFCDLDALIELRVGLTVRQIFEAQGEAAFRRSEQQCLRATGERDRTVIATGGGVMSSAANRDLLRQLGLTVWLNPSFETILARLDGPSRRARPLFRDEDAARARYQERLQAYRSSDFEIEVDSTDTPQDVAARIARLVRGSPCAI